MNQQLKYTPPAPCGCIVCRSDAVMVIPCQKKWSEK